MKKNYVLECLNEDEFRKKERTLKKYNMLAYKKLIFEYYRLLREGEFQGNLVSSNEKNKVYKYELPLPSEKMFVKVNGEIVLHYTVYEEKSEVVLETLTPEDILTEGHQKELTTYKGKTYSEKDIFKINLLNMIEK